MYTPVGDRHTGKGGRVGTAVDGAAVGEKVVGERVGRVDGDAVGLMVGGVLGKAVGAQVVGAKEGGEERDRGTHATLDTAITPCMYDPWTPQL